MAPPPPQPIVTLLQTPGAAIIGAPTTLSGTAFDPGGFNVTTFTWSIVDSSGVETIIGSGASVQWIPTSAVVGSATLKLTAMDKSRAA